ncbi:MAG: hypothetical protein FWD03_01775 [Defluviitaleaceae bacterium]|nr:hypothetical protein [Defluviitaleaceae bacterium]
MFRAVETIAQSSEKNVEQVILELLNPLSDILRLRIEEKNAETGSLFVEDAISLYNNAKKLLTATAMDVLSPRLIHSGRPTSSIVDFIERCKFGQTEIGSYVVSIVCPFVKINANNKMEQLSLFSEEEICAESLTRKVVNKLIVSAATIKDAAGQGNLEEIINQNAETSAFISANFLEALSGINIYRKDSALDITVKYAPTIKANTVSNVSVSVNHDHFYPIDALVNKLKRVQETEKNYVGLIKALDAPPDLKARKNGTVTIVYLNDDGKNATAKATLLKSDYDEAIKAHTEGRHVRIVGSISGQSSGKKTIECSFFEILT